MQVSKLNTLICLFSLLTKISAQITTSISRKLSDDAANQILPFYLTRRQLRFLSRHGCWCRKLLNPDSDEILGGPFQADQLDELCKQWQSGCNCLHSLGGSCHQYDNLGVSQTNILFQLGANNLATSSSCQIQENVNDQCLEGLDPCELTALVPS